MTSTHSSGKVFIVGAGIGGIEYLTVKAYQLLGKADVVIYDALVDESLLELVPSGCDRLYVGKRGGQPSITQLEINSLLVQKCQDGKLVVRLKSGDPFIFGRSVPEIKALYEVNCQFEVVPGISSAIAAPLLAGIPLTEAESSSCLAILTGHDLEILPWSSLAEIPTLVILMGTAHFSQLLEKLQTYRLAETPIAIIQWGGRPEQQVWHSTLGDILSLLPNQSLSPAVIVIGDVVKYRTWIRSATQYLTIKPSFPEQTGKKIKEEQPLKPLQGKTILVTRSVGQSSQFTNLLTAEGAEVIEMPTLAILPPSSWEALDAAIATLDTYDWLILTSANAVDSFFSRLHHAGKDSRALHQIKIAVVGQKTADVLSKQGITPDLIPPNFIADDLVKNFPSVQNLKILFPRVQSGGREVLIEQFSQQGAEVNAIPAYESGCPAQIDPIVLQSIQQKQIDIITFASSKTVKHFCQLLSQVAEPETWQNWLDSTQITSIGPQTSNTCYELLGRVDCEAKQYTLEGLTQALIQKFQTYKSE